MTKRIALDLLGHFEVNRDEMLERLSRYYFPEYMRLVGRMLPRPPAPDAPDLESLSPDDVARIAAGVREVLERVEAGEASLAELEAALVGHTACASGTVDSGESTAPSGAPGDGPRAATT